jgi:hypothetical protein
VVVSVTVQGAERGDPATSVETLIEAAERVEIVVPEGKGLKACASFFTTTPCSACCLSERLEHRDAIRFET